jgi:Ice-binding-like/Bacterial Ig-like domain
MPNRLPSKASIFLLPVLFLVSCNVVSNPPVLQPSDAPTVTMVVPQTGSIGTNREIAVVFSKPMDPASIDTSSFVVAGVTGTVTYDAVNMIGAFSPSADYAANTTFSASITTGAKDVSGTPLAAAFNFSFTTGDSADTSPPNVFAMNVAAGATCVPQNQNITVTFDEQMNSLTINPNTVFIVGVPGKVTYDVVNLNATFSPSTNLAPNTPYTIMITKGAEDMGSVPLGGPYSETFTTVGAQGGIPIVALCPFLGGFSVLAGSTVTNTGSTTITGSVGIFPGTAITGFPPGLASGTIDLADSAAAQAQAALTAGYLDAAGRSGSTSVAGDLVGRTLTAGVYKSTSSLEVSGDVTLDAQGDPAAVFIFQIASTLTTGSGSHVILANGASACNVFWQVGSSATLGTNSIFKGNILALTSITVTTGVNINGRVLARNGAVTLDDNVIAGCTCSAAEGYFEPNKQNPKKR